MLVNDNIDSTIGCGISQVQKTERNPSERLARMAGLTVRERLKYEDGWGPSIEVLLKLAENLRVDAAGFC